MAIWNSLKKLFFVSPENGIINLGLPLPIILCDDNAIIESLSEDWRFNRFEKFVIFACIVVVERFQHRPRNDLKNISQQLSFQTHLNYVNWWTLSEWWNIMSVSSQIYFPSMRWKWRIFFSPINGNFWGSTKCISCNSLPYCLFDLKSN